MRHFLGLLIFSWFLVFGFSCSKKTTPVQSDPVVEQPEPMVPEEPIDTTPVEISTEDQDDEEPAYILAEFRKTGCYGKCPSFSIKLYSDGRALYHGKAHVERIGHYEAFCAESDINKLFEAAELANYFVLQSEYPADGHKIQDIPKTITYLKRNGLEKRVINNFDAPTELKEYEKWLENFFESLTWMPVASLNEKD